MFEQLPDSLKSIPEPHYGPFTYRQPNLLPAALLASIIGPLSKSITEAVDPHERARKRLEDRELEYKATLYGRQLDNLRGGGSVKPGLNADGTPWTAEQWQNYNYKEGLIKRNQQVIDKEGATGGTPQPNDPPGEAPGGAQKTSSAADAGIPELHAPDFGIGSGAKSNSGDFGIGTGTTSFPRIVTADNFPTTTEQQYWDPLPNSLSLGG